MTTERGTLAHAVAEAGARIAPTWPLDRFIAVNPYQGYAGLAVEHADALLGRTCATRLLMPREWFREQWSAGRVAERHLVLAARRAGTDVTPQALLAHLDRPRAAARPVPLVTQAVEHDERALHRPTWQAFVLQSLSQACSAYFADEERGRVADRSLYAAWREAAAADPSTGLVMGLRGGTDFLRALPATATETIASAVAALGVREAVLTDYFAALLGTVQGWAAWCAHQAFEARQAGRDDDHLEQLLAMRIAWEWALHRLLQDDAARAHWSTQVATHLAARGEDTTLDWIWQDALELAHREPLVTHFSASSSIVADDPLPRVQAVFCIDVRSERMRRALEAASDAIHTRGFAGFFGVPLAFQPLASTAAQARLPALLVPSLRAVESSGDASSDRSFAATRRRRFDLATAWEGLKRAPFAAFGMVEAAGVVYGARLVAASLGGDAGAPAEQSGLRDAEAARLRPRLVDSEDGTVELDAARATALAARVLTAMSLTTDFAELVVLVAHGAQSANNPHAAGLDCGACGGHAGAVNARVVADLLNRTDVRSGLREHGIVVPSTTHFLAAQHNTTTDEVKFFDVDDVPAPRQDALDLFRAALLRAADDVRAERAPALGLNATGPSLIAALEKRACDWSEVRPEWGLAGNMAFVAAPRARTRGRNLAGRVFLHDYDWRRDHDFATLELILTAPLVVAHWINLQYYASTVDNVRYGSGNKVLHNVVGGNIGVFEGNGGDLRIGLPLQSLHDGTRWMHEPLRLAAFIEAPRDAIDSVIAKHHALRVLVDNRWLTLLQIDAQIGVLCERRAGTWADLSGDVFVNGPQARARV